MDVLRDPTTSERAYWVAVEKIVRNPGLKVSKGKLVALGFEHGLVKVGFNGLRFLPSVGRMFSSDGHARRRPRALMSDELAAWSAASVILTDAEPLLSENDLLSEIRLGSYGMMRKSTDGKLIVVQTAKDAPPLPQVWETEVKKIAPPSPEEAPIQEDELPLHDAFLEDLEAMTQAVAIERPPPQRNIDLSNTTSATWKAPRNSKRMKTPKHRAKNRLCPGTVIGPDGRSHPCRHYLTEHGIPPSTIRGGAIIDKAGETRQLRLIKQVKIESTEPPRSFISTTEKRQEKDTERADTLRRMLEGGVPGLSAEQLARLSPQQLDTLHAYGPLLDPEQAKAIEALNTAAATKVSNDPEALI